MAVLLAMIATALSATVLIETENRHSHQAAIACNALFNVDLFALKENYLTHQIFLVAGI